MTETKVNMAAVNQNLGLISTLGSHLGGKFFKVAAKETWLGFDDTKRAIELENNLNLCLNRSPRKFELRDFDVLAQTIKSDPITGTSVVFNPGTENEAEAAIVAGEIGFGQTTDEAIKEALSGQNRIFANGPAILKKVNSYNQVEIDRLTTLISVLQKQKDQLISTMNANEKKVNDFEMALKKSAIKAPADSSSSIQIQVEPASN